MNVVEKLIYLVRRGVITLEQVAVKYRSEVEAATNTKIKEEVHG